MCDTLTSNTTSKIETQVSQCNAHARRQLVEIADSFPEASKYVLEAVGAVYKIDKETKEKNYREGLARASPKESEPSKD